jgi:hypothetical protein
MPTLGQTETRSCQVEISASERVELGHEMGRHEVQIEGLKVERAGVSKRIRNHEVERNKLGHWLDTGKREQDVECWWRRDDTAREWYLQRPDTGETVETRPFSPRDMVHELPFHDGPRDDDQAEHVTADGEVLTAVGSDFMIEVIGATADASDLEAAPEQPAAPVVQLLSTPPRRPAAAPSKRKRSKAKATAAT